MTAPYYEADGITIYHGDCRDIDAWRSADVIITDPPYGIGYRQTLDTVTDYGDITGDDSSELAEWLVTSTHPKPMIVFGVNHFPHALPTPGRWICWDKRVIESADRMLGCPFELAWFNGEHRAGLMYRIMHGGVVNADGTNVRRHHPTQKPVTLMLRIINDIAPTGTIADPFSGSGSTLLAARLAGRSAIGVEIEERYCEIAAKRLAQGVLDFGEPA